MDRTGCGTTKQENTSMCSYVKLILALNLTWLSRGQANEGYYPAFGQNAFNYRVTPQNDYIGPTSQNRHNQTSQNMISSQPSQDYRNGQPQTQRLAGQNGVKGTIGVPYWNAQRFYSNAVNISGANSGSIGGQELRPFVPYTIDNAAETKASEDYGTSQPLTIRLAGTEKTGQNHDQSHKYDNGTNNTINIGFDVMEEIGGQDVSVTYNTEGQPHSLLWHVGIYSKLFRPYMQICGGTLVTMDAVISAAHCFWSDERGALPAEQFAVSAGKRYRPWADTHDVYRQTSDVSAIHIPAYFRGSLTSFQADIAVVRLTQQLTPSSAVRPACVSFDEALDDEQLAEGNLGTVLGWGLTQPDGRESPVLNYLELPVVPVGRCLDDSPADYLKYITADKICAGVTTGKALCRGDSGGGLVFRDARATPAAPQLRAVASTAPRDEHACNAHALAALTHARAHRTFLRAHVPGLERECRRHYHYPGTDPGVEQGSMQRIGNKFVCNCYCNSTRPK